MTSPQKANPRVIAGKVMVLAGEASGDAHAAEFIRHLRANQPDLKISGMGSQLMREAGADLFYDSSKIAVVGLVEVLKHWSEIKHAMSLVKEKLDTIRPDLLVLVDYPEFNLKMARHAKSLGIKSSFFTSALKSGHGAQNVYIKLAHQSITWQSYLNLRLNSTKMPISL